MPEGVLDELRPTIGGFIVRQTDEFTIDIIRMVFNWRVHVTPTEHYESSYTHGYCYFGTDQATFLRALGAALEWEDPLNTDPAGFDKKAF